MHKRGYTTFNIAEEIYKQLEMVAMEEKPKAFHDRVNKHEVRRTMSPFKDSIDPVNQFGKCSSWKSNLPLSNINLEGQNSTASWNSLKTRSAFECDSYRAKLASKHN